MYKPWTVSLNFLKKEKKIGKQKRDGEKLYSMKDCRFVISQELLEFRS